MNGLKAKIRHWRHVEYRLSELYAGDGFVHNTYGLNRRVLLRIAKAGDAETWALYKTGPFGMKERIVRTGWKL